MATVRDGVEILSSISYFEGLELPVLKAIACEMSLQKYSEPEDAFNEISVLPEGENMAAVKALEPSTVLPFDENKPLSIDDLSNSGKHPPILYSYTGGINDEQSTI